MPLLVKIFLKIINCKMIVKILGTENLCIIYIRIMNHCPAVLDTEIIYEMF